MTLIEQGRLYGYRNRVKVSRSSDAKATHKRQISSVTYRLTDRPSDRPTDVPTDILVMCRMRAPKN